MGNSEVGHLNFGAGAVITQDMSRIDVAIADGTFFRNVALRGAGAAARESGGRLHLLGLVSAGGVHSILGHLRACIELRARPSACPQIVLHAFTDGRDTPPTSSPDYLARSSVARGGSRPGHPARIATVMGRYWGMDRDRRWDRTKRAYDAIVHADGLRAAPRDEAVQLGYGRDETDEFVQPDDRRDARARVRDGDSVFTFNFRPDRTRQIVLALGEPDFS